MIPTNPGQNPNATRKIEEGFHPLEASERREAYKLI